MEEFDLVVIGAGPGGYVAAIRGAQEGLKTAIVEGHKMGGECLNYGCIPSKAFITAGHLFEQIRHADRMGIMVKEASVDMQKLLGWKGNIVKQLTQGVGGLLKANGVKAFKATATFDSIAGDKKVIALDPGKDSYDEQEITAKETASKIAAKNVIIATGSTSVELPFLKADGKLVRNSKQALDTKQIPEKLVVVGGGFIGLEIGCFFHKLGTKVQIVEAAAGILSGTDEDCVKVVQRKLKKEGMEFFLGAKAQGWKENGSGAILSIEDKDGKAQQLHADWILSTVGRKPRSQSLNLEAAGLSTDERGFIAVDAGLQTQVKGIYAIGDVIGGPMLAHKASKEGLVAIDAILNPGVGIDVQALPWAIFVDPEIASVGHTEESARAAGWTPVVGKCPFAANGRALTTGEADGFVKVIADAKTDRLLGAHMVGPDVSNLVAEVAAYIEMGGTAADLSATVHAHPTLPETILEAAESVHGKAIHIFERKKKASPATAQAST